MQCAKEIHQPYIYVFYKKKPYIYVIIILKNLIKLTMKKKKKAEETRGKLPV